MAAGLIEPAIELRPLDPGDAEALLDLRLRNRAFFEPWEPVRDESWHTLESLEKNGFRREGYAERYLCINGGLGGPPDLRSYQRGRRLSRLWSRP